MKRTAVTMLAVLGLTIGAGEARAQWLDVNRKLKDKKVSIHTAVLLPAQVTFQTIGAKGPEGNAAAGETIADSLYAAVSQELSARGVDILQDPRLAAKDDAAKYAIADLQTLYDNIIVQARKKAGKVKDGLFTLGDRVSSFAPGARADVLVFIRGNGQVLTRGGKLVTIATSGVIGSILRESFHGEITLVDAKTGEVMAFARFMRHDKITDDTDDQLAELVFDALYNVPLPIPPPEQ